MAYDNTIPKPTDKLKISQADLLANFAALQTLIDVNHDDFASANQGKHKWINFLVQAAAPAILADNGLYNKNYATTAKNESYIHGQKFAGTSDVPFSASVLSNTASPAAHGSDGWTYLPSGILVRWKYINGTGLTTIDLTGLTPAFNSIWAVTLTPQDTAAGDVNFSARLVDIADANHFSVYFSSRTAAGAHVGMAVALIIGN